MCVWGGRDVSYRLRWVEGGVGEVVQDLERIWRRSFVGRARRREGEGAGVEDIVNVFECRATVDEMLCSEVGGEVGGEEYHGRGSEVVESGCETLLMGTMVLGQRGQGSAIFWRAQNTSHECQMMYVDLRRWRHRRCG
jgi:hypothetical protein